MVFFFNFLISLLLKNIKFFFSFSRKIKLPYSDILEDCHCSVGDVATGDLVEPKSRSVCTGPICKHTAPGPSWHSLRMKELGLKTTTKELFRGRSLLVLVTANSCFLLGWTELSSGIGFMAGKNGKSCLSEFTDQSQTQPIGFPRKFHVLSMFQPLIVNWIPYHNCETLGVWLRQQAHTMQYGLSCIYL